MQILPAQTFRGGPSRTPERGSATAKFLSMFAVARRTASGTDVAPAEAGCVARPRRAPRRTNRRGRSPPAHHILPEKGPDHMLEESATSSDVDYLRLLRR